MSVGSQMVRCIWTFDQNIFIFFIKMDIISVFRNTPVFEFILNILLVYSNARNATLLEWNNYDKETTKKYKPIIHCIIEDLQLHTFVDPFADYREFVTKNSPKTHDEIANLLEFTCK